MKTLLTRLAAIALCLHAIPALAQRESFDATVTRRVEILIVELIKPEPMVFHDILFKLDSAEFLNKDSENRVDEIALALKSPGLKNDRFRIEGHTCDLADDDYNLKLSAERAETIRQRLIKQGVPAARLVAKGFGETELVDPVQAGDTPAQAEKRRQKSRRVVLRNLTAKSPSK